MGVKKKCEYKGEEGEKGELFIVRRGKNHIFGKWGERQKYHFLGKHSPLQTHCEIIGCCIKC